jgi:hypothetical protein
MPEMASLSMKQISFNLRLMTLFSSNLRVRALTMLQYLTSMTYRRGRQPGRRVTANISKLVTYGTIPMSSSELATAKTALACFTMAAIPPAHSMQEKSSLRS